MIEPQVTRMYVGGPYRLFSEERFLGGVPYRDGERQGFAGAFICAVCQQHAREVLVSGHEWVCRGCVASGEGKRDARGSTLKATRTAGRR
jgi:hypothetical protein